MSVAPTRWLGILGAAWGVVGVLGLLLFAIWRLAPKALGAYRAGLSPLQWLLAGAFCVFMAYTEGYRGFQGSWSPRTAARIRYLRDRPSWTRTLLAPLFSMGFFHAERRVRIAAYVLTTAVVILVLLVNRLDQPWRGIVDAGVVVGLGWGVVSLGWSLVRAFQGSGLEVSPCVPGCDRETSAP